MKIRKIVTANPGWFVNYSALEGRTRCAVAVWATVEDATGHSEVIPLVEGELGLEHNALSAENCLGITYEPD